MPDSSKSESPEQLSVASIEQVCNVQNDDNVELDGNLNYGVSDSMSQQDGTKTPSRQYLYSYAKDSKIKLRL